MAIPEIFRIGDDRLLCDGWQARTNTVVVRPESPCRPPHPDVIALALESLAARGVDHVLTAALDPAGVAPFGAVGFGPHEELCVLSHDLGVPPATGPIGGGSRTRRGSKRRDAAAAAEVDAQAFATGTSLDDAGLRTIFAATPQSRFRVVGDGELSAYAITGVAGDCGYIQRVAVDPVYQRQGHARALVADALGWFRRRRVTHALVNTQCGNVAAQRLYAAAGFVSLPDRLAVWAWHRESAA